jgi:putative transposase
MPRVRRFLQDRLVYHVLNRGNRRATIFLEDSDYYAFLTTLVDAMEKVPMRLLAFCLMPNHWHLVLWPPDGSSLSAYMEWMMNAHVRRYHARYGTWGTGHLYQGRFKSFPIETGNHLLTVYRYVEANAWKAKLVGRAEEWPWSSMARDCLDDGRPLVVPGPIERPVNWSSIVNNQLSPEDLFKVRLSLNRQSPFGGTQWVLRLKEGTGCAPSSS